MLVTPDILRAELKDLRSEFYRAIAFQTVVFTGIVTAIVAALTKL